MAPPGALVSDPVDGHAHIPVVGSDFSPITDLNGGPCRIRTDDLRIKRNDVGGGSSRGLRPSMGDWQLDRSLTALPDEGELFVVASCVQHRGDLIPEIDHRVS